VCFTRVRSSICAIHGHGFALDPVTNIAAEESRCTEIDPSAEPKIASLRM
jgi:hypothetical protein